MFYVKSYATATRALTASTSTLTSNIPTTNVYSTYEINTLLATKPTDIVAGDPANPVGQVAATSVPLLKSKTLIICIAVSSP